MANPWAGEVDLVVSGRKYPLKLTLGALAGLEQALGQSTLLELVKRFEDGAFSTVDLLHLLRAGMEGGGHDCPVGWLERAEIEGGILEAARVAARLLALSFVGPREGGETRSPHPEPLQGRSS